MAENINLDVNAVLQTMISNRASDPGRMSAINDFLRLVLGRESFTLSDLQTALTGALQPILNQQGELKMALQDVRDKLASQGAVISEVAGDVAELKASNDELAAKVEELKQQLPDSTLVQEIEALVDAQATSLRTIADVVPEPAPEEPPVEPAPEA